MLRTGPRNVKQLNKNNEIIQKHIIERNILVEEQHNEILKNAIVRDQFIRSTLTEHLDRKRHSEEASLITDPPNLRDSTPPSRSISSIFFQSMQDHSISEDDNSDNLCGDDENENASTEIQHFISKMENVKHRLFDYCIVNISEKNLVDPINKVFSSDDKERMRKIWKKMEPSIEEKKNTTRRSKWDKSIKPLINKYASAIEVKSDLVFDDDVRQQSTRVVFEIPFDNEFGFKRHYDMLWVQDVYRRFIFLFASPFNILRDANTQEIAYRESFVNPLIPKAFDDLNDKIRFQIGEIESTLRKQHRNQTRGQKPRVSLGSKHDGILKIYMNATEMEIGFLEVVGNAIDVDLTGYYEDMEKLFKAMHISIFYQRQHHLRRNATEEQILCVQSFGVLVYQREMTIYTMHRAKGGLHIVDVLTKFTIPDNKDQAYVIDEIIEKVYFFKSRVMDYYLKLQEISRKTQKYSPSDENPLEASPSKRSTR